MSCAIPDYSSGTAMPVLARIDRTSRFSASRCAHLSMSAARSSSGLDLSYLDFVLKPSE